MNRSTRVAGHGWRRYGIVAVSGLAVTLLASCGGGDGTGAATPAPPPPQRTATTTATATSAPSVVTNTGPAVPRTPTVSVSASATAAATRAATTATSAAASATAGNVASGPYDPCALLDAAQVASASGVAMDAGKQNTNAIPSPLGQHICTWVSTEGTPIRTVQVSIIRQQDFSDQLKGNGYTVQKLYDDTRATMNDAQPVTGVGDQAYRSRTRLYVRKGTVQVSVDVAGGGNAGPSNETLIGLARTALERLKA